MLVLFWFIFFVTNKHEVDVRTLKGTYVSAICWFIKGSLPANVLKRPTSKSCGLKPRLLQRNVEGRGLPTDQAAVPSGFPGFSKTYLL